MTTQSDISKALAALQATGAIIVEDTVSPALVEAMGRATRAWDRYRSMQAAVAMEEAVDADAPKSDLYAAAILASQNGLITPADLATVGDMVDRGSVQATGLRRRRAREHLRLARDAAIACEMEAREQLSVCVGGAGASTPDRDKWLRDTRDVRWCEDIPGLVSAGQLVDP